MKLDGSAPARRVYFEEDVDRSVLAGLTIAVVGYGNQGCAQANNLRDSGHRVVIGNREDEYRPRAIADGFTVLSIPAAVAQADVVFVLIPDEDIPAVFDAQIRPALRPRAALVFASGYTIASGGIRIPEQQDILLIAPRMLGAGVREKFLNREGFHCFIGIERDASGHALERLLALTGGIGGLRRGAIRITFKQEVTLDLFTEQAFGPAFGRVLVSAIEVLVEKGIPPEAALVEMYMSGEMSHAFQKMADVGIVNQLNLHSTTSQYGSLSRGIRFLTLGAKERMRKIYEEIERGDFFAEWKKKTTWLKFKVLKLIAGRHPLHRMEKEVRKNLRIENGAPAAAAEPEPTAAAAPVNESTAAPSVVE